MGSAEGARAYLAREFPEVRWPAASTIGVLFDRAGLTRFRAGFGAVFGTRTAPLAHCTAPNTGLDD